MIAYQNFWGAIKERQYDKIDEVSLHTLIELMDHAPRLFLPNVSSRELPPLRVRELIFEGTKFGDVERDDDWKMATLDWWYHAVNRKSLNAIKWTAGLYLAGSVYFGWRTLDGIFVMGRHLVFSLFGLGP